MQVLYFGVLKESLGRERESVELAEGACVADLIARYGQEDWAQSIAVAVNQEYAKSGDVLRDGDEVALLPPVSGGAAGRHTPGAKAPFKTLVAERPKAEVLGYLEAQSMPLLIRGVIADPWTSSASGFAQDDTLGLVWGL